MTIIELKTLIADLPDDTPVEVYSGSVESPVNYHCSVIDGEYLYNNGDEWEDIFERGTLVFFAEN